MGEDQGGRTYVRRGPGSWVAVRARGCGEGKGGMGRVSAGGGCCGLWVEGRSSVAGGAVTLRLATGADAMGKSNGGVPPYGTEPTQANDS